MRIKVKPLSVNRAWQGRRYKTKEYKEYEKEVMKKLSKLQIPKKGKLQIKIKFGYKNKLSDIDNAIKPFVDILQKKYGFNDNRIYRMELEKEITEEEYIEFKIKRYNKK